MRQRGTLQLDHNTWRLQLRRTDEHGTVRRTWVRIGTKAELPTRAAARRAADRYLDRLAPKALHAGTPIAWSTWCDRYIDTATLDHATGTRATQQSIIDLHLRGAFSGAVHEIDEAAVRGWVLRQVTAGAAASTIGSRFAVLRRMLREAEAQGLAATPPTSRRVRLPKNEQMHEAVREKAFTEAECARIFAAATIDERTAFMLGRYLGLRPSEVCGLTWSMIDLSTGVIEIRQQALDGEARPLKTAGSKATLQAPPELLAQLVEYREGFEPGYAGYLFTDAALGPRTAEDLRDRLYALLAVLGIERKGRGPHGFRHACALAMAAAGVNPEAIRRAMRHSSLRVTAIYLSAAPEDIAAGLARGARRVA